MMRSSSRQAQGRSGGGAEAVAFAVGAAAADYLLGTCSGSHPDMPELENAARTAIEFLTDRPSEALPNWLVVLLARFPELEADPVAVAGFAQRLQEHLSALEERVTEFPAPPSPPPPEQLVAAASSGAPERDLEPWDRVKNALTWLQNAESSHRWADAVTVLRNNVGSLTEEQRGEVACGLREVLDATGLLGETPRIREALEALLEELGA